MEEEKLYLRQKPLELDLPDVVIVIGVGGVGSWAAIFAAMAGIKNLILIDPDNLEIHNLNRLPFTQNDINKYKVAVVAKFIQKIRPNASIIFFAKPFQEVKITLPGIIRTVCRGEPHRVVVIDAVDSNETSKEIQKFCKENKYQLVDLKYDGFVVSAYLDNPENIPETFLTDPEDQAGYLTAPSFVAPAAIVAAFGIIGTVINREVAFRGDLRNLLVKEGIEDAD